MIMSNVRQLPRLGITDAMQLFGMTARAIRFYEERGLVQAGRDRLNARIFDAKARGRLAWIAKLRAAGISLPDIQEVLTAEERSGEGRACAVDKLSRRRAALTAELRRIDEALDELSEGEALICGLGEEPLRSIS